MIKGMIFSILMVLAGFASAYPATPDPTMTSGDLCTTADADFVEFRYAERIPYCVRNVSREEKTRIYERYHIPARCRTEYTIDHFIPLALGGSNDPRNLWPEHRNVKATRQGLEQELYYAIRSGRMSHAETLAVIVEAKTHPPAADPTACN